MRSPSPVALLLVLLVVGASSARAQPRSCETAVRRIQLEAGSVAPVEVCVSPGLSTTLLFDSALAGDGVVLEGREHFQRVEAAGRLLVLVPSERLEPGLRLRLEVRFAEGELPAGVTFVLVAHRAQAERQVEVARPRPLLEPCQQELRRLEAELQQLRQGRRSPGLDTPASLGRLILSGALDAGSLERWSLTGEALTQPPGEAVQVEEAFLFRSKSRLVARLRLRNTDAKAPWALEGAELLSASGEARGALWVQQAGPVAPGALNELWVEWELPLPSEGARAPRILQLWDAGRARPITLPGLELRPAPRSPSPGRP